MADHGPNPYLLSIETGPQAPEWETVSAAMSCQKAHAHFTKLC